MQIVANKTGSVSSQFWNFCWIRTLWRNLIISPFPFLEPNLIPNYICSKINPIIYFFYYSQRTGQNYYPPWNREPNHWLSQNYLSANCIWSSESPMGRSARCTKPKPSTSPSTEVPSTLHGDLWPLNIFPIRRKKTSKSYLFPFDQFVLTSSSNWSFLLIPFSRTNNQVGILPGSEATGRLGRSSFIACSGRLHDGRAILCRPWVFGLRRFEPILEAAPIPPGSANQFVR